jgi:hypothetical protein
MKPSLLSLIFADIAAKDHFISCYSPEEWNLQNALLRLALMNREISLEMSFLSGSRNSLTGSQTSIIIRWEKLNLRRLRENILISLAMSGEILPMTCPLQ